MSADQRRDLALQALTHSEKITVLAEKTHVSRKYVYSQRKHAEQALDTAFAQPDIDEEKVLFTVHVTKTFVQMMVLVLILRCRSPYRGVQDFFKDLFGFHLSLGTIHNIVVTAAEQAKVINAQEEEYLKRIRQGLLDEIFQSHLPVLAGVDPFSMYCFLLSQEKKRDGDTWGLLLLELFYKGLKLDTTTTDGGKGMRAGLKIVYPNTPCHADVFHPMMAMSRMCTYLENKAYGASNQTYKLENKMQRAKRKTKGQTISKKLALARKKELNAIQLVDNLQILTDWLRCDVLALCGEPAAVRQELFDFIVAELKARESLCSHRIKPIRKALESQRDDLLAFVVQLDEALEQIAKTHSISLQDVRQLVQMLGLSPWDGSYWKTEVQCRDALGQKYQLVLQDVQAALARIVRASSLVENLNSRLRHYFFLRRHLGADYLALLRFYLNHHRFTRSRKDRQGKSPAEMLLGKDQPHWLEQLGYKLFCWNA